ncbi:MAG: formylglycine-generating enzyme family protein, partial [Flavobacteriia bacterium]|nr:formylglycine-generating enzyme family protein [Flavobacteriia bacterium]
IWVEPGTFTMGQAGTREVENNVTITKGFYLGKYEITQAQYQAVMGSNSNPSHFKNNLNRPVERVNIPAVVKFIELLNKKEATNLPKGYQYGLPTDAEWEYACRAGTNTLFSWGDEINQNDANWRFGDEANLTHSYLMEEVKWSLGEELTLNQQNIAILRLEVGITLINHLQITVLE